MYICALPSGRFKPIGKVRSLNTKKYEKDHEGGYDKTIVARTKTWSPISLRQMVFTKISSQLPDTVFLKIFRQPSKICVQKGYKCKYGMICY